jgi:hypothetical protein
MSQWKIFNNAKRGLCSGQINVGDAFVVSLHTSGSNAETMTLENINQITGECSGAMRQPITGAALHEVEGGACRLVANDVIWIAEGGTDIADVS